MDPLTVLREYVRGGKLSQVLQGNPLTEIQMPACCMQDLNRCHVLCNSCLVESYASRSRKLSSASQKEPLNLRQGSATGRGVRGPHSFW